MKNSWKFLGLVPVLITLFFIAQLGSVGFALGLAGFAAALGLFGYATRKRLGRRYDQNAPGRAEAELQAWNWGGAGGGGGGGDGI
jgi:hypothetical protein